MRMALLAIPVFVAVFLGLDMVSPMGDRPMVKQAWTSLTARGPEEVPQPRVVAESEPRKRVGVKPIFGAPDRSESWGPVARQIEAGEKSLKGYRPPPGANVKWRVEYR